MIDVFKIKIVNRVPIIEKDGARWMVDTGCPHSYPTIRLSPETQLFHGIPGLRLMGLDALRRYVKIDYAAGEIVTSDEVTDAVLVSPSGKSNDTLPVTKNGFGAIRVPMTVAGKTHEFYIDTGAAYSYVHGLDQMLPVIETVRDNGFSGKTWSAKVRRTPCDLNGHDFEVLCADARDNGECPNGGAVPPEGVIGYDFFKAFTVVIDRKALTLCYA